ERGEDRFHDARASPFVRLVEHPAEWTEPRRILGKCARGHGARDGDRLDLDPGPPTLLEDATNARGIGEGELSGRVRHAGWHARQERRRSAFGGRHEWILVRTPPHD